MLFRSPILFIFKPNLTLYSSNKFKSVAKKSANIDAINFLIWYDKEYKNLRNDPQLGQFLEKEYTIPENMRKIGSILLDETRKIVYQAYEKY